MKNDYSKVKNNYTAVNIILLSLLILNSPNYIQQFYTIEHNLKMTI